MAARKRLKSEREAQLLEMADLASRGATERELAERFQLSRSTVHRDLKTIEKRWQARAAETVALWKGRLLARHDQVIRDAWAEFDRSKNSAIKTTDVVLQSDQGTDQTGEPTVVRRIVTSSARCGDPHYLAVVVAALAEQARIIGAYGPIAVAPAVRHVVEVVEVEMLRKEYERGG